MVLGLVGELLNHARSLLGAQISQIFFKILGGWFHVRRSIDHHCGHNWFHRRRLIGSCVGQFRTRASIGGLRWGAGILGWLGRLNPLHGAGG